MLRYTLRNEKPTAFDCPEGMPEALHRLLMARGIPSREAAEAFLRPGVRDLIDPFLLSDMAPAVEAIRSAMAAGETICVYGDYDVDGVCASAILYRWLVARGAKARVYLPSRHTEGYGLNGAAIEGIARWAGLLVTVDCGVTSMELVALAKERGLKVVVTDHHRPAEGEDGYQLPECPVVNPLLGGYPFPHLCGAGVAWKLVWALEGGERSPEAALECVDIAALATVADLVSLTGENRAIVSLGLARMNAAPRVGVAALMAAAGLGEKALTASSIAFQLAPRLNAGGRLGSAERSLNLLLATDADTARALAEELDAENTRRKSVESEILNQALARLEGFDFPAHRALILAGRDWNPGVIGLTASRLVERFHYPVVLLSDQGDTMSGSCRSIEGVDIHAALTACAHTLVRFGGHRQAAGLTLLPEKLPQFREAMDAWLEANVDPAAYIPARQYDLSLDFEAVSPALIHALEALEPTGFGNPAPLFRASAEVVEARAVGANGAHLKLQLAQGGRRLDGIAFRMGDRAEGLAGRVDALFVPKLNSYMGRVSSELEVRELEKAGGAEVLDSKLADEFPNLCDFLTEVFYNKKIPRFEGEPEALTEDALLARLAERPQGTLIVTADFDEARRLLELAKGCPPDVFVGRWPGDPRCFNALCVCPVSGAVPAGYRRVVLSAAPAACLPAEVKGRVYTLGRAPAWRESLPDVDALREAFRGLSRVSRRPAWCASLAHLARLTAGEAGLEELTAAVSILTLADMGLFELTLDARPVTARRSDIRKAEPEDSAVWRQLRRVREGL